MSSVLHKSIIIDLLMLTKTVLAYRGLTSLFIVSVQNADMFITGAPAGPDCTAGEVQE